ncbi:extracellular solute-binding protein [Paenibacillus sp. P96]|uniref:Extracellular solute-binding protein n=1 Tax=Paenibacillus zeirhizosphaerae TaxID=2987519 RepID=A0ABT9FVM0_9BACL|nr:extracellular solute-binding protein [Paenibacillus sp. P96]MDP4098776.1 extracellular solute-binding protein [Paenibacillus sp. P96]
MKTALDIRGVILTLIILALIGTGCTSQTAAVQPQAEGAAKGQKVLKVAWWGNDGRNERTMKVIELFEKKYPNIKVEPTDAPNGDYWVLLAMKAADQDFPDVIQMDYKYINEYIKRKLIMPLDDLVASGKLDVSDLDDSSRAAGTFDEKLYGIVTGVNAQSVMYNPEIFEQTGVPTLSAGYTYEDLIQTARELKEQINQPDFIPIGSGALDFAYYLRQHGDSYYAADGKGLGYDKDEYLSDFFKMEKMLIDEGLMASPDVLNALSSDKDALITNKRAAFHTITSNNVGSYSSLSGTAMKLLPFPALKGGPEGNYVKPSMYFSVSSYTKQSEEAALFIDFFINDIEANEILLGERGVPATAKVREHLLDQMKGSDREQYVYMEHVEKNSSPIDPPVPLVSSSISTLFSKIRNKMLLGQMTPEESAKQFRDGANEIFADAAS